MLSRRGFLAQAAFAAPALPTVQSLASWAASDDLAASAPRARFWTSVAQAGADCGACHEPAKAVLGRAHAHTAGVVRCLLCARGCSLAPGQRGQCRARMNLAGEMKSLVYGRPLALNVDPIEKKPFYHFLPGASAFSFGTAGCPLRCRFCQNWELSQSSPEDHDPRYLPPAEIVGEAVTSGSPVIAFTYNEPTVFTEYLLDVAAAGRARGLRSVLVSCGFMREPPLDAMCDALAAIKIDLKGFDAQFYRDVCGAALDPVLRSLKQIGRRKLHLEIVNLVVPTLNDSDRMLEGLAGWILGELGPDVPVHFTRFHPDFQLLHLPPTPIETLERAREIALRKGLRYAYVGNVPGHAGNYTYCPGCGRVVVRRSGFFVVENLIREGRCASCRHPIAGIWA